MKIYKYLLLYNWGRAGGDGRGKTGRGGANTGGGGAGGGGRVLMHRQRMQRVHASEVNIILGFDCHTQTCIFMTP
jgi:hypothetical protein